MSFKEDTLIQIKSFDFALKIIQFYQECNHKMNLFYLSKFFVVVLLLGQMLKKQLLHNLKKILYQNFP